jgi:hypothetical protein
VKPKACRRVFSIAGFGAHTHACQVLWDDIFRSGQMNICSFEHCIAPCGTDFTESTGSIGSVMLMTLQTGFKPDFSRRL